VRGKLRSDDDGQEDVENGEPVEVVGEPEDVDGKLLADGGAFGRRGDASGSGGGLHVFLLGTLPLAGAAISPGGLRVA
jgi:hypothetical protein